MLGVVSAVVGIVQFAFLAVFLQQGNSFPSLQNYGGSVMAFLVSGALFTGFMSSSLSSFSQLISSEQRTGTLEAVLTTPFSIGRVIAYAAVSSFIQLVIGTFLMITFFWDCILYPLQYFIRSKFFHSGFNRLVGMCQPRGY